MKLKGDLFLLLTAAIWGLAFVAQRVGMDYIGPFAFNGVRFLLGSLTLLPMILFIKPSPCPDSADADAKPINTWKIGILAGIILYLGASLQQVGLIYTSAGKAAFITAMYILIVPVLGIFLKHRISRGAWAGAFTALAGLYLLCVKQNFSMSYGDLLELASALFWAAHILLIDRFTRQLDTYKLAFTQFATCSVLSLLTSLCLETVTVQEILAAGTPILYGGIGSVGIAYTLQLVGQKHAAPSHASIILSMETVFAALGGYLILHEVLSFREIAGCAMMMAGMLLSQLASATTQQKEAVL